MLCGETSRPLKHTDKMPWNLKGGVVLLSEVTQAFGLVFLTK
jgi:hypothetical protein